MIDFKKTHEISYRIYTEDTDLMGIVYHANYLRFFERARTEMLRSYGLSLTTLASYGTHFAIHQIEVIYHKPARLEEIVTIKTHCHPLKRCSLQFEQAMMNEQQELLCSAQVNVVCVDQNLRPKRLPFI